MPVSTKLDGHAHIRIYKEDEQPDLIAAIQKCASTKELARLNYLNMERLYEWPHVHKLAIEKAHGFGVRLLNTLATSDDVFTTGLEEVPAQRTEDEDWPLSSLEHMFGVPTAAKRAARDGRSAVERMVARHKFRRGPNERMPGMRRRDEQTHRAAVLLATIGAGCVLVEQLQLA